MVKLRLIVMIHDLRRQGLSVSAIARKTGLNRKTVRKYLARGLDAPAYGPRAPRPRNLAPYEAYLRERIGACEGLSGRRLHREIRDLGYTGGYSTVTDLLREIRPRRPHPFECRFETAPGKQAQMDFAEFTVTFDEEPDVRRRIWLFSFVLGHSRWLWGRFCANQKLGTVLRCHVEAFEACGGATAEVLYDRMKTAVLGEQEDGTVVYNPSLVALLGHYGSAPRACRAYRAKTKGKVERPFRYIRQDFFLDRSFRNLEDLNVQFDAWRSGIANERVHGTTNRVVRESFAEEQPHLHPLPAHPYDAVLTVERRVSHEGMVSVDGNLYSVPDRTRKRVLEVQHHPREIRIFEDGQLIARHPVLQGKNQRRVDPGHRRRPPSTRHPGQLPPTVRSSLEMPVAQRPLAFYDAVARRLAAAEACR